MKIENRSPEENINESPSYLYLYRNYASMFTKQIIIDPIQDAGLKILITEFSKLFMHSDYQNIIDGVGDGIMHNGLHNIAHLTVQLELGLHFTSPNFAEEDNNIGDLSDNQLSNIDDNFQKEISDNLGSSTTTSSSVNTQARVWTPSCSSGCQTPHTPFTLTPSPKEELQQFCFEIIPKTSRKFSQKISNSLRKESFTRPKKVLTLELPVFEEKDEETSVYSVSPMEDLNLKKSEYNQETSVNSNAAVEDHHLKKSEYDQETPVNPNAAVEDLHFKKSEYDQETSVNSDDAIKGVSDSYQNQEINHPSYIDKLYSQMQHEIYIHLVYKALATIVFFPYYYTKNLMGPIEYFQPYLGTATSALNEFGKFFGIAPLESIFSLDSLKTSLFENNIPSINKYMDVDYKYIKDNFPDDFKFIVEYETYMENVDGFIHFIDLMDIKSKIGFTAIKMIPQIAHTIIEIGPRIWFYYNTESYLFKPDINQDEQTFNVITESINVPLQGDQFESAEL